MSDDLVVIDKPPDVRMDGTHAEVTVQSLGRAWLGQDVRWCHRLDYGTSGILVGALSRAAAADVGRAIESGAMRKTYVGVVRGFVRGSFEIVRPIAADGFVMRVGREGKRARTLVTALEKCRYRGWPVTKVALQPITGRRHQLRVHLASIGHPLVGDATYDGSWLARAPRMMLHAIELRLATSNKTVVVARSGDPFPIHHSRLVPRIAIPLTTCKATITQ